MNLLTDQWIPVQQLGIQEKITLQQLLCGENEGELCLPRDDMELACLQLLVAIVQVLFTPADKKSLVDRVKSPLSLQEYVDACEGRLEWFDLEHPDTPFMQFRGVKSKEPTGMEKLLAGVADGTNKAFMNPQGLGAGLCSSCVAIALYNTAYNCPSMGGGFKAGMRGSTPITVLIRAEDLRRTIWKNVLTDETWDQEMSWHRDTREHVPNYVEKINAGEKIHVSNIGLARGLFWQPAHFELCPAVKQGDCSLCGCESKLYTGFKKEKFSYTAEGVWPYPLSARVFSVKKGVKEEKFPSFTTTQPSWVHLAKLIFDRKGDKDGYQSAPVIRQLKSFGVPRLDFIVGGYRNNQATVLERRHELFTLADGWADHGDIIDEVVKNSQEYRKSLSKALYIFGHGIKDRFAGAGVDLADRYSEVFYQETERLVHDFFAEVYFDNPELHMKEFYTKLEGVVLRLFDQAVNPYRREPKMLQALASSKRLLKNKYLKELKSNIGVLQ